MQSTSKILMTAVWLIAVSSCTQNALAQAGKLDPSFGQGGTVITDFSNLASGQVNAVPFAALEQPDGKIVVVGGIIDVPALASQAIGLVRYLPNGRLDSSFGQGGIALAAWSNFINSGFSLALMPDGRIVVAGEEESSDGSFDRFGVARFNPDGTLDSTFGGAGTVTTEFFSAPIAGVREAAFAVIVQSDGKIVAGGIAKQGGKGTPTFLALARYHLDGSLDNTFGRGGKVLTTSGGGAALSLALLANGHVLALSATNNLEFSADGTLQSSVIGGVIAATSIGGSETFQTDDKFLRARPFSVNRRTHIIDVVRFQTSGGVDNTYNDPPFNFGGQSGSGTANAIAIQPDGKAVVSGFTGGGLFGVARLDTNGVLDSSFGRGGSITTSFPGFGEATSVTIQTDGKIIAVGIVLNNNGAADFALARYLGQ
jgi:uncharacterized delta-60 repeat protein